MRRYSGEFARYTRWVHGFQSVVPGRDAPWDAPLLWRYLQFRSDTCKASTLLQIMTMLAHFAPETGFVLPNEKHDGDPELRRATERIKKQLRLDAALEVQEDRIERDVVRATPLAKRAVELILSSLQVWSERNFLRLSRADRHHVLASAIQYTAGMRFGHFLARAYNLASFQHDDDGSWHLRTNFTRRPKGRMFRLDFLAKPRHACQVFRVRRPDGSVAASLTAATLLAWHFRQVIRAGETLLFRPVPNDPPTRANRQKWLRRVLLAALPLDQVEARRLVRFVTPHSFRSGLAGDLHRAGVDWKRIGAVCRWESISCIRLYSQRPSLSMSRTSQSFRVLPRSG